MSYRFGNRSKRRMDRVDIGLISVFERALSISPIDFGIANHGGWRNALTQNGLFKEKRSRLDGFVKRSRHQDGLALDIFAFVRGKPSLNKAHLAICAGVILSTSKQMHQRGEIDFTLTWGGTFGSKSFYGWDYGHFHRSRK